MKKILIVLILLSFNAEGAEFYVGTGITHYSKPANGVYYQEGYPYKLELTGTPYLAGVSFDNHDIQYRVELNQLGQAHTMCLAEADGVYAGYARHGAALNRLQGNGNITGLVMSASKGENLLSGKAFGEAGLFAYRQNWKVAVYDSSNSYVGTVSHSDQFDFRPVIGAGYRFGNIEFIYRFFMTDSHRDNVPFVSGSAQQMTMRVLF